MTTEEAKTKWCPYDNYGGGNRAENNNPKTSTNCLADKCAAWRWIKDLGKASDQGYCGLAGK